MDFYEDAALFSAAAGEFLRSKPVRHNLILSLLDARLRRPEDGSYWIVAVDGRVAGAAFQSPLDRWAVITPMEPAVAAALAEWVAESGTDLPGVNGEAATAAAFAGRWIDATRSAATPTSGVRLYELGTLNGVMQAEGHLVQAEAADLALATAWLGAFQTETHQPSSDPARGAQTWIEAGLLWLWKNEEPLSMAAGRPPVQGVVRVSSVYTPPEHRRRGYAAACVYGLSKHLTDAGYRCVLYTDLGNPTSNSIDRRIGFRAVAEGLHYRFHRA